MILMTHGIVGAAVGRFFQGNPLFALIAGFISHFLIDAIPHWQYPLKSMVQNDRDPQNPMKGDMLINANFFRDLILVAIDFTGGLIIIWYAFETKSGLLNSSILAGALGGVLPDALTFAYFKFRIEPLKTIYRLQLWANRNGENHILKNSPLAGCLSQASFAAAAVLISKLIIR